MHAMHLLLLVGSCCTCRRAASMECRHTLVCRRSEPGHEIKRLTNSQTQISSNILNIPKQSLVSTSLLISLCSKSSMQSEATRTPGLAAQNAVLQIKLRMMIESPSPSLSWSKASKEGKMRHLRCINRDVKEQQLIYLICIAIQEKHTHASSIIQLASFRASDTSPDP